MQPSKHPESSVTARLLDLLVITKYVNVCKVIYAEAVILNTYFLKVVTGNFIQFSYGMHFLYLLIKIMALYYLLYANTFIYEIIYYLRSSQRFSCSISVTFLYILLYYADTSSRIQICF